MKILHTIHKAFRIVVLKPFDYLLFGGSGVLWRTREEWAEMLKPVGSEIKERYQSSSVDVDGSNFPDRDNPHEYSIYNGLRSNIFYKDPVETMHFDLQYIDDRS